MAPDGVRRHLARVTGFADTQENRAALRPLAKLIGAAIEAGKTLPEVDAIIGRPVPVAASLTAEAATAAGVSGPTVADYFKRWLAEQLAVIRKAQARDYRRHFGRYLLPALGKLPLAELKAADVRGLQAEL